VKDLRVVAARKAKINYDDSGTCRFIVSRSSLTLTFACLLVWSRRWIGLS
jgi:hypothetical protein